MQRAKTSLVRQIRARPRLVMAFLLGVVLFAALPDELAHRTATRFLASWNAAVGLFLVLTAVMMARSTPARMRSRAQEQDAGQVLILLITVLSTLVSLGAVVAELSSVKDMAPALKFWHIVLVGVTVSSSWFFMHAMFALHYAHDYYLNLTMNRTAGLLFPGTEHPDYWDFLYFSGVIGTSGQTADVSFTSAVLRRVGLVHCIVSYFFNTTVVALTINMAASVI